MTAERVGWRGDIEGLRTLAIVPVVLFHLDRTWAPGGFLGVDLFLVISGYLIARMLLTGSYLDSVSGIRRFLRRRFLRIMPALAVTVAATALVFVWLALPTHHTPFFLTGLASLFGVSNIQLARLSIDYFAPAAGLNPFLHTWSVSLEDQFYVGFVLLLALAARVAGPRRLPAVIVAATVVAVEYAWLNPAPSGTPGFFALRLRAWEFLLGATALVVQEALTRHERAWPEPVRWLALVAILWAIVRGSETGDVHQYVLCVACGALLVRTTPASPSALSRGLAHRVLRAIGRRSFTIYLVHFPLLKLLELFADAGRTAPAMGVAYLAATGLLAELLHRTVERPYVESYREPATSALRGRPRGGMLWASAVVVTVICLGALPRVSLSRTLVPRLARMTPRDYPGSGPEVILLGDSHAQQLYPALVALGRSDSVAIVDRTMIGCLPSEELTFVRDGLAQPGCQYMVRDIVANVAAHPRHRRVVLIAMRAQAYLSDRRISRFDRPTDGIMDSTAFFANTDGHSTKAYLASLDRLVGHLAQAGVPVLFLAPLPEMRLPPYSCYFRRDRPACTVPRAEEEAYRKGVLDGLRLVAERRPSFTLWDPFDAVCPGSACRPFEGERLVFSDDNHLSAEMVVALAPSLREAITHALAAGARDR